MKKMLFLAVLMGLNTPSAGKPTKLSETDNGKKTPELSRPAVEVPQPTVEVAGPAVEVAVQNSRSAVEVSRPAVQSPQPATKVSHQLINDVISDENFTLKRIPNFQGYFDLEGSLEHACPENHYMGGYFSRGYFANLDSKGEDLKGEDSKGEILWQGYTKNDDQPYTPDTVEKEKAKTKAKKEELLEAKCTVSLDGEKIEKKIKNIVEALKIQKEKNPSLFVEKIRRLWLEGIIALVNENEKNIIRQSLCDYWLNVINEKESLLKSISESEHFALLKSALEDKSLSVFEFHKITQGLNEKLIEMFTTLRNYKPEQKTFIVEFSDAYKFLREIINNYRPVVQPQQEFSQRAAEILTADEILNNHFSNHFNNVIYSVVQPQQEVSQLKAEVPTISLPAVAIPEISNDFANVFRSGTTALQISSGPGQDEKNPYEYFKKIILDEKRKLDAERAILNAKEDRLKESEEGLEREDYSKILDEVLKK